jgi:hypothetical protein
MNQETPKVEGLMRLAVVLHPKIESGVGASAAAIVVGGLRSEGFGEPILDADGNSHAAILWNMVVLRAKSVGQLTSLLSAARDASVQAVAFTSRGQELSNSFPKYREEIARRHTTELEIVAVGLFGLDEAIRKLTRAFSIFR